MSKGEAVKATRHHLRQMLMNLYQASLESGHSQKQARNTVQTFIQDALAEWETAEFSATSTVSPVPLIRKAIEESKRLGPPADSIYRILIDLQLLLGGKKA
jgi:hypothetical protein